MADSDEISNLEATDFPPIIIYWYECVQLQAEDRVHGT